MITKIYSKYLYIRHKAFWLALCLLTFFSISVFQPVAWSQTAHKISRRQPVKAAKAGAHAKKVNRITPQIPKANRYQKNKVFLENADILKADAAISEDYQILKGNVKFRRGDMFMFCDSAYFYDKTGSLDAFGHVKMTQGDTLFVYADVLHYFAEDEVAQLRNHVRLENRNMTLITDSLDYEVRSNVGYYFNHGTIVDSESNELSSEFGRYELDTKNAEFSTNVKLVNDKYEMETNLLRYNTATHVANIVDETVIVSDSNTIHTSKGWYDTSKDDATLYDRSTIVTKDGSTLVGDTVFYDRKAGYGEAKGNIVLTDTANSVILDGNYGYHNENTKLSFATNHARAREFSQKDTLYLHADTLKTLLDSDSVRLLIANKRVKFFRIDLQGLCDSMAVSQRDSVLHMYRHGIVWNENRQISGDVINVHYKDSTVDWATLPNYGFMVEQLGDIYFNQLKGKEMKATFVAKELRNLNVKGNVQTLFFPQENDSTYNKFVRAESSFLNIDLKPKQKIERIAMWPEVTGSVIPLYIAKKSQMYLDGFTWYDKFRPHTPDDIFDVEGLSQLFETPNPSARHVVSTQK